jgi:hypothetical protein
VAGAAHNARLNPEIIGAGSNCGDNIILMKTHKDIFEDESYTCRKSIYGMIKFRL